MKKRVYSRDNKKMSQNGHDFEFVETSSCGFDDTCLLCSVNYRDLCGTGNLYRYRDDGLVGYWKEMT